MKHISPTLLILAALATAPAAHALSVKDDDLSLGLKLQLQVRAEKSWADGRDGNRYNVSEAVRDSEPDDLDFYVRRARIGFAGTWKGEYKFAYLLRNDNQDKAGTTTAARTPQTHVAYLERLVKQESLGLEHGFKMGLDYAFFNGASAAFSSSSFLFPTERATGGMLAPRGAGVAYKLSSKMITWGVDVQNNTGDNVATAGAGPIGDGSANQGEGLFYGTRVQFVPFDSDEKGHMKPVESFLGKDGQGVLISAEYGINQNDNTGLDTTVNTTGYGLEVLGHLNAITALAEWRQTIAKYDNATADDNTNVSTAYIVQIGYALPMGDQVLEPALRFTRLNAISQTPERSEYGSSEYGGSGYSYDVGVNYYIHGHSNKVQLALQHWRSEGGADSMSATGVTSTATTPSEAKADIVRFQWQLSF